MWLLCFSHQYPTVELICGRPMGTMEQVTSTNCPACDNPQTPNATSTLPGNWWWAQWRLFWPGVVRGVDINQWCGARSDDPPRYTHRDRDWSLSPPFNKDQSSGNSLWPTQEGSGVRGPPPSIDFWWGKLGEGGRWWGRELKGMTEGVGIFEGVQWFGFEMWHPVFVWAVNIYIECKVSCVRCNNVIVTWCCVLMAVRDKLGDSLMELS